MTDRQRLTLIAATAANGHTDDARTLLRVLMGQAAAAYRRGDKSKTPTYAAGMALRAVLDASAPFLEDAVATYHERLRAV